MHIIGLRLKDDLEVERRLRRHRKPSPEELDYPNFPYLSYVLDFEFYLEDNLPWHWHHDLEIIEVTRGRLTVRTSKSSYPLEEGELCFINAHTLHQILPDSSPCILETHLFLPNLISGGWGGACDTKYVSPVLDCRELDCFPFSRQNAQTQAIRDRLAAARSLSEKREFAYEFDVRHQLTEVWKILFTAVSPRLKQRRLLDERSEERMRAMLTFIQKNHAKKIGTAEIAASALISERECFRCFQKTLGITPIRYLQNYRVRMAARRLLETDDTVLSISQAVGFSDNSYFGKIFQKYLHCTPLEFRKRHRYTEPNPPEEPPKEKS